MSENQFNITKWLSGASNNNRTVPVSTGKTLIGTTTTSTGSGKSSTLWDILAYVLAILIVIIVILLFINYFITPIFKLRPGGPGIIPVPGFDDGKVYWTNTSPGQILNKDLPITSLFYGYTVNLDVFIENPLQFSTAPRIFFSRGASIKTKPSGESLMGLLDNYNLVAALLPDTNDLVVSVLNTNNAPENIIVPNVPIQQPFRLSMVVMEQALEVYINGKLIRTRKFSATPKDVRGDIYPTSGIEINAIKVHNLKIWSRILSISEIREATPALSSAKDFGAGPMPSSTSCSSSPSNSDMDSAQKAIDRYSKLSIDSVSDVTSSLL
jgi:hypothetical protein